MQIKTTQKLPFVPSSDTCLFTILHPLDGFNSSYLIQF